MSDAFSAIKAQEEALLCRSYSRYPVAVVRGKGSRLWDVDGKEYVDLLAGIAVTALGHCNDEVCAALEAQAHKLWHVSNLFYQEEQLELARLLLGTSHHGKVFFCNSGAEANEACIKLARRYMRKVKQRDAYEIITLGGCFHGRTFGALAATGRESLSDGFTPLPDGFKQVPANDLAALEAAITPATAAVLLEVVQGEGGIVPLPGDYLRGVEALCRKHDILFICDEVQAGLCRTGTFWAFQQHGLTPDAISMAKSLANGLPMGAMLATDEMARGFEAGSHATTFGGGALASGVAAKCVEIMLRDKLADRAAVLGRHVMDRVRAIQDKLPGTVREVRGLGLMIGIELAVDAAAVWRELISRGFICNLSHGVTLRLLPALTIDKADLDAFIDTLEDILRTAKSARLPQRPSGPPCRRPARGPLFTVFWGAAPSRPSRGPALLIFSLGLRAASLQDGAPVLHRPAPIHYGNPGVCGIAACFKETDAWMFLTRPLNLNVWTVKLPSPAPALPWIRAVPTGSTAWPAAANAVSPSPRSVWRPCPASACAAPAKKNGNVKASDSRAASGGGPHLPLTLSRVRERRFFRDTP